VICSLRLVDFRCFEALSLELPAGTSIFVGGNAQGKTTVLEAVCVLVRLHSPRTHRMGQMVRFGAAGFGAAGDCWGEERRVRYGAKGPDLRIDGRPAGSQGDYLAGGGLLVWMGSDDLRLVGGPGEGRRRFLDFAAMQLDAGHRRHLGRYRRALKARNLLLKERRPDEAHIAAYTEMLVTHGEALQKARRSLVERLAEPVQRANAAVSRGREAVELEYRPAGGRDLRAAFSEAAGRERRQGQTVVGPHRDDLLIKLNGRAAADFGSEGQQRTLALALKLGQGALLGRSGRVSPVYLIDDIFGELDPQRRNALMEALPAGAQKLITTTSLAWLERPGPTIFRVAGGSVGAE